MNSGSHNPCFVTSRKWLDCLRVSGPLGTGWRWDSHGLEGGLREGIHPKAFGAWYSNNISSVFLFAFFLYYASLFLLERKKGLKSRESTHSFATNIYGEPPLCWRRGGQQGRG